MRKIRILEKAATYHVSAKINRRENIFTSDEIKNIFLDIIKRSKKKYKYLLHNFVIMDNHIHLLIEPLFNESLSKIMQWILSVFAMYYNKLFKLEGHLWRGRFWSKIIDDIKQLFDTFKYISENPVKANKVNEAKNYTYGGLYYILNEIFDIINKPKYDFVNY